MSVAERRRPGKEARELLERCAMSCGASRTFAKKVAARVLDEFTPTLGAADETGAGVLLLFRIDPDDGMS